jgi:hypothetical protein
MTAPRDIQIFQILGIGFLSAAVLWLAYDSAHPQRAWLFALVLLTALCIVLGMWLMKLPAGILISNRNLMSLSRLQVVCWTLVIFSGYIVVVMQRILHQISNPLSITIDNSLWAVMGISFASFVGTPLILSGKTQVDASPDAIRAASIALQEPSSEIERNAMGKLYSNPTAQDARFSDVFQGDEIGNTAYVDVSKVQMFVLTVLLVGAYCSDLWHMLGGFDVSVAGTNFNNLNHLPSFSADTLKLLAISHAGYLTFKTVNHTDSASQ